MFINACSVEDQSQRNPPASVTKLPQLCPVFDVSESLRFVLRVSTLYFVFGEDARVSQRVSTYRFTHTHTHARAHIQENTTETPTFENYILLGWLKIIRSQNSFKESNVKVQAKPRCVSFPRLRFASGEITLGPVMGPLPVHFKIDLPGLSSHCR